MNGIARVGRLSKCWEYSGSVAAAADPQGAATKRWRRRTAGPPPARNII